MKKFISMVMAAAMVVTMVPATAFAASATTTAKIVDAAELTVDQVDVNNGGTTNIYRANDNTVTELQLKVTDVTGKIGTSETFEVELNFDNVETLVGSSQYVALGSVHRDGVPYTTGNGIFLENIAFPKADKVTFDVVEKNVDLEEGDIISVVLNGNLTKTKVGTKAMVSVSGDLGKHDDLVYASIVDKGIKVTLDEDVVNVAPEEITTLETIVVEPTAGAVFADVCDADDEITLKLSKGFEFVPSATAELREFTGTWTSGIPASKYDENEISFVMGGVLNEDDLHFDGLRIEATTADAGDVATLTVKIDGLDAAKVEVATVVDFAVVMELSDADEDVPTFYNGVNVANAGLNVDDDHKALEVTIKETFAGAWSNHKDWTLSLPEGVFVTAVKATEENTNALSYSATGGNDFEDEMAIAYQNGDHEYFKFKKYSFQETSNTDEPMELSFTLTLVAEPDFVGDVVLTLEGAALETQEVTIAKVLAPYTIKAEQNDVIIDYRYTEVPTDIVITEAEAGLWAEGLEIAFAVEKGDYIVFEDDATFTVNEESEMEIDDEFVKTIAGVDSRMGFKVEEESDEEAAVITISDIELFMQRNIPAGPYDLEVFWNSATNAFLGQGLFAPDANCVVSGEHTKECIVDDVDDYSTTAKEAFINVVTAGRDQDDASFTTKIVVPVGETTMYAGEKAITLDVPAYINANDYVMLPVRAVATALGIDNNAVQWDQATKTVIIMYGQRIITMTAGQSVVYVSGTAIPAKAAVEIVDGRAFLGLRDLATTLGISNINYDATTKTATLN